MTGLPRTGSTILCDLLNQDPGVTATSTTETPELVRACMSTFTGWPAQGRHEQDPNAEADRRRAILRSVVDGAHSQLEGRVIDKSRSWASLAVQMSDVFDRVRMVVTVRDLRSVVGSIERRHRESPTVELSPGVPLAQRVGNWLNRNPQAGQPGLIGAALSQVEELIHTGAPSDYLFVRFERFAEAPKQTIDEVREFLDLPAFDHDPTHVEQTATDLDSRFIGKFPHRYGDGEPMCIEPQDPQSWKLVLPEHMGQAIVTEHRWYQDRFGWGPSF